MFFDEAGNIVTVDKDNNEIVIPQVGEGYKKCNNTSEADCKEGECNMRDKKLCEELILICDECRYYFHIFCLLKPLEKIPKGSILDVPIGSSYCCRAHLPMGFVGKGYLYQIVLAGGYEYDKDFDEHFYYTSSGWPINIKNADISPYWKKSSPVRVSRSYKLNGDFSEFALAKGICYNDLYRLFHRDGSKSIHWKLEGKKIEKLGLVMYDSERQRKRGKEDEEKPVSKKQKSDTKPKAALYKPDQQILDLVGKDFLNFRTWKKILEKEHSAMTEFLDTVINSCPLCRGTLYPELEGLCKSETKKETKVLSWQLTVNDLLLKFDFPRMLTSTELKKYSKIQSFGKKKRRYFIDEEEASRVTEVIGKDKIKDKIILEFLPGPGLMTRQFLNHGCKSLIPLEPSSSFIEIYEELEKVANIPVLHEHFNLRTSSKLYNLLYDVSKSNRNKIIIDNVPFENVHPDLLFFGIMSGISESFQFYYFITHFLESREGFFSYGRFPLYTLCAPEVIKSYNQTSLLGFALKAMGQMEYQFSLNKDSFIPKNGFDLVKFIPSPTPNIKSPFSTFFYVTTCLMHRKSQLIANCLESIAPGVSMMKKNLTFDTKKKCIALTMEELDQITLEYIKYYRMRHGVDPTHDSITG
ncbi:hypothetical protein K502DRAFT_361935 [Neoconidiobolus thromboides FSU 785]|nr:hypothetical protein K502DRAFT_361935 [Neoconidiobolus thromboides FSU 785]